MKNNALIIFAFAILLSTLGACNVFFEERLDEEKLTLLAPADSTISDVFLTTFWWEELEGADFYTLQIVKPTFVSPQQFVLDSAVRGKFFELQLSPGTYQWRVRAENASYTTPFETRTLFIDTVTDISNQIIGLSYPTDNTYLNSTLITLNWMNLGLVDEYRVRVGSPDIASGNFVYDFTWEFDSVLIELDEGSYQWQVRGQTELSNTIYSSRSFVVDTTKPVKPTLLNPADNSFVSDSLVLSWNSESGILRDSVAVSTDVGFNTLIAIGSSQDKTFELTGLSTGTTYYWKIKSIDKALNVGGFSNTRSFTVQ